ncbi:lytic transglycosylase domain-containing protein [Enterovirga sp.]|uniref:lytic transglycosylase domain-containing protein n=1 Tax=Enterovirga sp. TaxID=2026350 RepID=UPI002D1FBBFD|nr:lytic transglycosylase domain-containing protein [Enterovirga sp.]
MARSAPTGRPAAVHPHAAHIAEASRRFGIPTTWITAVMGAESSGDARAVSAMGAMGLMQVMPDTWADLRQRHGLGRDPFDPHDNILAGAAHLREVWDRYGDVAAMLAAYNAGSARYDKHRSTGKPLPAETRAYVDSLAPMLRGELPSRSGSAVARPLDWREAAIFVARDNGASATMVTPPDRLPGDTRSSVPPMSKTPSASQPNGLFVTRNAGEDRP